MIILMIRTIECNWINDALIKPLDTQDYPLWLENCCWVSVTVAGLYIPNKTWQTKHNKQTLTCNTWPGHGSVVVFVPTSASRCQQPTPQTPNRPFCFSLLSMCTTLEYWLWIGENEGKIWELCVNVCACTVPGGWLPWRDDVAHATSATSAPGRRRRRGRHPLRCGFYRFLCPLRTPQIG